MDFSGDMLVPRRVSPFSTGHTSALSGSSHSSHCYVSLLEKVPTKRGGVGLDSVTFWPRSFVEAKLQGLVTLAASPEKTGRISSIELWGKS